MPVNGSVVPIPFAIHRHAREIPIIAALNLQGVA
jgi:hypothetical protein